MGHLSLPVADDNNDDALTIQRAFKQDGLLYKKCLQLEVDV
jgi:hypothetical protein